MIPSCIASIKASPPFSWFSGDDGLQFLMLGPEKAGKTTLLYKLKIMGWKKKEIIPTMNALRRDEGEEGCKDPAYHYEELSTWGMNYGIWEVPGYPVMRRMWPMFYRYLRMDAVIYVVDAFSHWPDFGREPDPTTTLKREEPRNTEKLAEEMHVAKQEIAFLLNEEELRCAAFVLILNTNFPLPENLSKENMEKDAERKHEGLCEALKAMLGVPEFEERGGWNSRRFRAFVFNCAEITREHPKWKDVVTHIQTIYRDIGEGSRFGD